MLISWVDNAGQYQAKLDAKGVVLLKQYKSSSGEIKHTPYQILEICTSYLDKILQCW